MNNGTSGTGRARAGGPGTGRRIAYPETLSVGLSAGWLSMLSEAAAADGMSRAEFVRAALRRALDASRKRAARGGAE